MTHSPVRIVPTYRKPVIARQFALTAVVIVISLISVGPPTLRADTATGTGWKGTSGSNWSTSANWDSTPPKTDGTGDRSLFFGQGYFNAGNTGALTANNDLSNWNGHRVTFEDIAGQTDKSFTITGNGFTLFDFAGNTPKIENNSTVL